MSEPDEVLKFWFADAAESPAATEQRNELWFKSDKALDKQIWELFGDSVVDAANGRYAGWSESPEGQLALILLLDQFPRNIFRGTAEAFRYDSQALALSQQGISTGQLAGLSVPEQAFFLMPYQHVEDLALQDKSVELYNDMVARAAAGWEKIAIGYRDFAILHRNIVAEFGRFPHRNALLGRVSTEAEARYLQDGGESFGQSN